MAVVQKKAGGSSEAEEAAHLLLAILDRSLLIILSSVLPLEGLPKGLLTHTDSLYFLPQRFVCWLQLCFHKCAWPSVTAY